MSKGKQFDITEFNAAFEEMLKKQQEEGKKKEAEDLSQLNATFRPKRVHELTIGELLVNMKDAIFDTIDDLLGFDFSVETFTKNNRLFYLGLFVVLFTLILYIVQYFTLAGVFEPETADRSMHIFIQPELLKTVAKT
jgi:hypothetical protein